jgi:Protein of unknown function (DUF2891)
VQNLPAMGSERKTLRACIGVLLAVAAVASSLIQPIGAQAAESKSRLVTLSKWEQFKIDREDLLGKLAPAFVSCFARRDSAIDPGAPIFHGCLDWHSAVHAAYSHHVMLRRTDDDKYLDLIDAQFAPQGISLVPAEEAYEQAKGLDVPLTENPYGFGWFLVLAKERELTTGDEDLRSMADYAAQQLVTWFDARIADGDAQQFILDRAHPNYSFSLLNLDVWARYTKDKDLLAAVDRAAAPLMETALDGICPVDKDILPNATGFQSPCLMRLAAVAHIKGDAAKAWVTKRLPKKLDIDPVTEPTNCHSGGLNFTRAFALYQLYRLTGNTDYRDNYADLIRYHVGRPDLYMGEMYAGDPDYMCYSHWVAQVGVRAISLSYEP